jgi:hypothetical protein
MNRLWLRPRRVRLGLAVAAFALAATAAGVTPARAGEEHGHAAESEYCGLFDLPGAENFDVTRALAGASTARGSVRDSSRMTSTLEEVPEAARGRTDASFTTVIPVYLHIITAGKIGDLSSGDISRQMQVLNATFAGFEGGVATGFQFELVSVDRTNNADWFYNLDGNTTQERAAKSALRQGGANALNIWTTFGPTYLGFATFPSSYKTHPELDGIVLDYQSFPGGAYGKAFSLGETATHEVGHWLGLYHTFQGGCNNYGDYVADTPPMLVPTSGCPVGKDTCKEPGLDPIRNYMDYSFDSCYTEFTADQRQRMQDHWNFFRANG